MSAALSSGAPVVGSRDRESGVPRAFVVRRSSVKSVARGDNDSHDTDSLFAFSTLTSGVRVNWAVVGSRMARRQKSKSGNMEAAGKSATNAAIVRSNAKTTAGVVETFVFST